MCPSATTTTTTPSYVYDHDFLLGIREYVTCPRSRNDERYKHSTDSSTLFGVLRKLCCMSDCDIHKRKKHYRKRGWRGGYRVHLKRLRFGLQEPADFITSLGFNLESYYEIPCEPELGSPCLDCGLSGGECCGSGCFAGRLLSPGPASPRYFCSDCVFPISRRVKSVHLRSKHGLRRRGVNLENLRPIIYAPSLKLQTDMFSSSQKCSDNIMTMVLLNARSIVNKTFLINDFILS